MALILVGIIENIIIKIFYKKDFSISKKTSVKDKSVLKDMKNLMVHKVAGIIAANIDIVLISKFRGLGEVLIYSTYLMYLNALVSLTNKVSTAMIGTIGNIIIEDKVKSHKVFLKFNGLVFFAAMIVVMPFNLFINSFIEIFYGGKVVTSIVTACLFAIILAYSIIRIPLLTYSEGAGLFKETRICPIIESIINLTLSVILVNFWGINGCLIGTIVSLVVSEYFIKPHIIYKNVFNTKVNEYYKQNFKFFIILLLEIVFCYLLSSYLTVHNFHSFLTSIIICVTLTLCVIVIIYKVLKQDYLFDIIKEFKRKKC